MLGRASGSILSKSTVVLVGVALVVAGAAGYVLFTGSLTGEVTESVTVGSDTFNTSETLYPGESVGASFTTTNDGNSSYDLLIQLQSFENTSGDVGAEALARNKTGGYVDNLTIENSNFAFDLLNDGVADYHNFASGATVTGELNLSVPGDAPAGGNVSAEISLDRGKAGAPSDVVEMHWNADANATNCGDCHTSQTNASVTYVHNDKNATSDCQSCHEDSFQDTHMDCTSACHDSFPITGSNGTDHTVGTYASPNAYLCGDSCHGGQLDFAHRNAGAETDGTDHQICLTCHGDTINNDSSQSDTLMDMHANDFTKDCESCHGLGSTGIHQPYGSDDCSKCHTGINS